MVEIKHKIGESYTVVKEARGTSQELSIRRVSDGYWYNFLSQSFEDYVPTSDNSYRNNLEEFPDNPEFSKLTLSQLPAEYFDSIFVYRYFDVDGQGANVEEYERHVFGERDVNSKPNTCKIYGTLRDVSGSPLSGQKVEAYLNRAGYFTHKAGLVGYAATVLTDEAGYFEIPLVQGLDVTINVPIIGFTQRGFVPRVNSIELTTSTLLNYEPSH